MTASEVPAVESVPLSAPRDGVPDVLADDAGIRAGADRIASGAGPVAVDAERASGYRYGQRAYLVQLRREGAGTLLVDPAAGADLGPLAGVLATVPWILHAASQDLPCLHEIGLHPPALFDTELAGRLLGFPRVGLAALVEQELGLVLAKEHSAVDWSTRPLPEPWLVYAALDVEVLVELRARLEGQLEAAGKAEWARQEFEHARLAPDPEPRTDPWRRLSGMHKLRGGRQLAVARELWYARDRVARDSDTAPGRILPDASIVAAAAAAAPAKAVPAVPDLRAMKAFNGRGAHRYLRAWTTAVDAGLALPAAELPSPAASTEGPPPPRTWADRDPAAAARLTAARGALAELAERTGTPAENLLPPDALKRFAWDPAGASTPAEVEDRLTALGARPWQTALTASALAAALHP